MEYKAGINTTEIEELKALKEALISKGLVTKEEIDAKK